MSYNNWKLMDKIDVAVRNGEENYHGFTGYIVEHDDKKALETAKDWARIRNYNRDKKEYDDPIEPIVHTFNNEGFTVTILNSAGGSSQGGRLSFWRCKIEKDGVEFIIGVNDAILADLIKNSDISNGLVKQKVMFARKSGQPGLLHDGMDMYKDATADMKHKADMKNAKKTKKWEAGGVYQTITQTDVCFSEVWDTMEKYEVTSDTGYWGRTRTETKLRKAETPKKVYAWTYLSNYRHKEGIPETFNEFLKEELGDSDHVWFSAGIPPYRAKTQQLKVTEKDLKLVDKILAAREDSIENRYDSPKIKGRYVRVVEL